MNAAKEIVDKTVEIEWTEGSIIGFLTNVNESNRLVKKLDSFYEHAFDLVMDLCDEGGEKIAMIENLYVEPYFRTKGIGSTLLKRFIQYAKKHNIEQIVLMADKTEDNLFDLVKWYESFGFRLLQDDDEFSLMKLQLVKTS